VTSASADVCVIGGGISGLVTAHSLVSRRPDLRVVVLEASSRPGGALRTEVVAGVRVEAGADSFLTRSPEAVDLCRSLGLGNDLVAPAVFGASVWVGGRLVPMPPGLVFGMPASARAALASSHLPLAGRLRAAAEPLWPGPRLDSDTGVGELVRRRYGRAVLERSVDPLLAGTRAGDPEEISVEAALPQIWALTRGHRSITRALANGRARGALTSGPPPFRSVSGGLERLVDALVATGDVEVRTGARAEDIASHVGGLRVRIAAGGDIACRAIVAALPACASATLLRDTNPAAAHLLDGIAFASVATIVLVYGPDAGPVRASGSGMLVPSTERTTMSACTWYSVKWPESAPGDGGIVVRCFVGRSGTDVALGLADDELASRVADEVGTVLSLSAPPQATLVTRWERGLPQYRVGHGALVDRIESAVATTPGVWVTGASYRGSGIPDCVRHAQKTATAVLDRLQP
jgi:protoporphyrinogen/coproporphyrinogen III oxidase